MTLNVAQYLAPFNSAGVLTGLSQGVKKGAGITIATDGTITLSATEAASIGFVTSGNNSAAQYVWPTATGTVRETLMNDGNGNLFWSDDYVHTYPLNSAVFPQQGAAALPAGVTASRPAGQSAGWIRFNTETTKLEVYNGVGWVNVAPTNGGIFSFISATSPAPNGAGDIWLDTNTYTEKVWTGSSWCSVIPTASSTVQGTVQIGTNIAISSGVISVATATGVAGGVGISGVTTLTDNVTSTSITSALTANQGKLLQDQITALGASSNLTFGGTINGSTGNMVTVTPEGATGGLSVGSPLPAPSAANKEIFVIVTVAGTMTPSGGSATVVTTGDWWLSTGTQWQFLDVGFDAPYASTTTAGIVCLATDAETGAGVSTTKALTPANLAYRTATESRTGIIEIANQTEANDGNSDSVAITPLKMATAVVQRCWLSTRGTLITATSQCQPYSLLPGGNNCFLMSDSTAASGLNWCTAVRTISTGTGLTGGPITTTGTVCIAQTGVLPGTYTNTCLTVNSEGQLTFAGSGPDPILCNTVTAKGDLIAGVGSASVTALPVGPNGYVLTANAATTSGLSWACVPKWTFIQLDDVAPDFDGTAVTFNLTYGGIAFTPVYSDSLMVFLGGVAQIANSSYIISGSQITFSTAPTFGTSFQAVAIKSY